jgi:hypothetical protein
MWGALEAASAHRVALNMCAWRPQGQPAVLPALVISARLLLSAVGPPECLSPFAEAVSHWLPLAAVIGSLVMDYGTVSALLL